MEESDESSSSSEELLYSGATNPAGEAHGRGTLIYAKSKNKYEGFFKDGKRNGRGRLYYEEDDIVLIGTWKDDSMEGPGKCILPDGSTLEGSWVDGTCSGDAIERSSSGRVMFLGKYREGVRHGKGILNMEDGGRYEGVWVEGKFEGKSNRYFYPDGSFLHGAWKGNEMQSATYFDADGKPLSTKFVSYRFDKSTAEIISSDPHHPDPYEIRCVYVKRSTIKGANEGLFAKVDLPADRVVSFYNGIRIPLSVVNKRKWIENDNTISLNQDDIVIDVPPKLSQQKDYCATLGHKANHFLPNNCKYDVYQHPRFGHIKCIRTLRPISKDEELFVDYGYDKGTGPAWYRNLQKNVSDQNDSKKSKRT